MDTRPRNGHSSRSEFETVMSDNPNGLHAFAVLGEFLETNHWHPQQLEDRYVYRMPFQGSNGVMQCYAQIRVDAEQLLFYALAPIKVAEPQRLAIAEFLTRANYGMYIGNFELDLNDGEIRYKSSLDFEGIELSFDLIRNAIYPAVRLLDRYLPGILQVAFGGVSPAEAIKAIEDD